MDKLKRNERYHTHIFIFTLGSIVVGGRFHYGIPKYMRRGKRPVSNVNIGKPMLEKMASNTNDEELKKIFQNLNSIRIVTTEDKKDAHHYFKKANELAAQEFSDYQEVVSVNERNTKINVLTKSKDDKNQDIIFIGLDEDNKLTIINITGKIDFHAISKLSDSLSKEAKTDENPDEEEKSKINK